MNVIIYCRVSSDEQSENTSLDFQEKILKAYCSSKQYNIVMCKQEDFSAKHHDLCRPAMKEIYNYCRKHKNEIDLILFLRWDRFSRSAEFAFTYKRKFMDEMGISLNSVENPIDFESPDWATLLGVYCGSAQSENNKISKRTKDGIRETLIKGRCANRAPRGYKNVRTDKHSTHIEIDEKKANTIQNIFNEVAKNIETPCYIRRKFQRQGFNIPETSFFEMLRNRFYIGKIRVPAYKEEPEYYVNGEHEAIIDEETFYKVQEILDGKRKKTPKLSKAINPDLYLRKFLICPVCGHALTGATSSGNGGKYTYYFCCNNQKHIRMRAEDVNEQFARYTAQLKPNKEVLDLYNEILKDLQNERKGESKKEVSSLQNELSAIQKRINSIEDKYLDGDLTKEQYNRMLERYTKEASTIQQQVEMRENPNRSNIEPKLNYSINLINNIDSYIRNASVGVKIKLISSMFPEKIEFDGKTYRTNSYNKVLDLIYQQTNELRGVEKKNGESFSTFSASVPRPELCKLYSNSFQFLLSI
ncbi:recombinase family protein [Bacteroides thetaiotaomicron]|uniref:recombinase family protein n=1 Tax=Bacteroides thetaiotaomicron TaxID=818 RepID=UPI0039B41055